METIHLDNAATTPVDPRGRGNAGLHGPSSGFCKRVFGSHGPGRRASARIEAARSAVAAPRAAPEQIVWTSGATEANNLAIFGAARFHRPKGAHIVTSRTEHPSVLDPCRRLEREGFEVSYLRPGPDGIVEPPQIEAALRADTILVSLMHVNNETGVIQDVGEVGRVCRGVLLHVDAAQSAGKLGLDVVRDRIDLLALTAHKLNGPKGAGARACDASHGSGSCRSCTAAVRNAVCAPERCPPTRSWALCRLPHRRGGDDGGGSASRICGTGCGRRFTLPGILLNGSEHRRAPG